MSKLVCSLSGTSPILDPVVTPTGQICSKSLLLTKLTETNGQNPFDANLALDESQLVALEATPSVVPPRAPTQNSIPSMLDSLSSEYNALVLELFDTRKALEETRKELSVALYQNDAAVRVIARVSMERDVARRELQERFSEASSGEKKRKLNDGSSAAVDVVPPEGDAGSNDVSMEESEEGVGGEVGSKIPKATAKALENTWKEKFNARKSKKKDAGDANYGTVEQLQSFHLTQKKNYHKTSCKGVLALVPGGETIVSAGRDKQIIAYNLNTNKVAYSASTKIQVKGSATLAACTSDETDGMVTCAFAKGIVNIYTNEMQDCVTLDLELVDGDSIAGLAVHATQRHIIVACSSGSMYLIEKGKETEWKIVAKFQGIAENEDGVKCTCIGLHPDGLILGIGCSNGSVGVWDLKTEKLASTLKVRQVISL